METNDRYFHSAEMHELCNDLRGQMEKEINSFSWMSFRKEIQPPNYLIHNSPRTSLFQLDLERQNELFASSCHVSDGLVSPQIKENVEMDFELSLENIHETTAKIQDILVGSDQTEFINIFPMLNEIPLNQLNEICETLHLHELEDAAYLHFVQAFVKYHEKLSSYVSLTTFCRFLFVKKIERLCRPLSRVEKTAVLLLATSFSQQITEGILYILEHNNFGNIHCEIFGWIIKEAIQERNGQLLQQFLKIGKEWNEFHILLLQIIIDTKVPLNDDVRIAFLKKLSDHANTFKKNLKFSKLIQNIIIHYGDQFDMNEMLVLEKIILVNETFLKKSLENLFKKLN